MSIKDEKLIIRKELEKYIPYNEQEENDKVQMLKFIDSNDDVLTRNNIFGHFSASAFVVDESFCKALLLYHNILEGYIYPGGHADGEWDLLNVAKREVEEETGLVVEPVVKDIFSICTAPTKGHVKKGKYVSAHLHFDILYLFVAKNDDMEKIRVLETENKDVKWVDLEESYNEEVVDWVRPINEKIVSKIKKLRKKD